MVVTNDKSGLTEITTQNHFRFCLNNISFTETRDIPGAHTFESNIWKIIIHVTANQDRWPDRIPKIWDSRHHSIFKTWFSINALFSSFSSVRYHRFSGRLPFHGYDLEWHLTCQLQYMLIAIFIYFLTFRTKIHKNIYAIVGMPRENAQK